MTFDEWWELPGTVEGPLFAKEICREAWSVAYQDGFDDGYEQCISDNRDEP